MGHTLIVPKKEVDYIFDLEDNTLAGLMIFAKQVAYAIQAAIPCKRIGVSVIGLEVPHTHVHLFPIHRADYVNFTSTKLHPTQEDLIEVSTIIVSKLTK